MVFLTLLASYLSLLSETFQVVVISFLFLSLLPISIYIIVYQKFHPLFPYSEENPEQVFQEYEKLVEQTPTPNIGIDLIIDHLEKHQKRLPSDFVERFLVYLSRRADAIGQEARKRQKAIG